MAQRILIVDDDPQARLMLAYILKRRGFDVVEADSGPSALLRAGRDRPDLVLLDVMMPGMDGFEVCSALRSARAIRRVPVVLLTAKTDTDARELGRRAGADDYLTKPVHPDELIARIHAALVGDNFRAATA